LEPAPPSPVRVDDRSSSVRRKHPAVARISVRSDPTLGRGRALGGQRHTGRVLVSDANEGGLEPPMLHVPDATEPPPPEVTLLTGPPVAAGPEPRYVDALANVSGTTVVVTTVIPKRTHRLRMVGSLVGVVALISAGSFALSQLHSNSASGGAASPQ